MPNDDNKAETSMEGTSGAVVRVADTVRRSSPVTSDAVNELLVHLERKHYPHSPRYLGRDEDGRQIVTYLKGRAGQFPLPPYARTETALVELVEALAQLHRAVAGFSPAKQDWPVAYTTSSSHPTTIVHGDLWPGNTIWDDHRFVGFIDWDFAHPGLVLDELGQLAWHFVPLRGDDWIHLLGWQTAPERSERLRLLCDAYGDVSPADVVDHAEQVVNREAAYMAERANYGPPWDLWARQTASAQAELAWLRCNRGQLLHRSNRNQQ